jgi:hypothetical protein
MKKHNFKIGDNVFDYRHGWMIIDALNHEDDDLIEVITKIKKKDFHSQYFYYYEETLKTLSFTEYTLEGITQERLNEEFKVGDIGYFFHDYNRKTCAFGKLTAITHNNRYQISSYNSHGSYQNFSLTPPDLNY